MGPATFGIVGGAGFRAQFFLRIAAALPDQFSVSGLVVRDQAKSQAMTATWGVPCYPTLDALVAEQKSDFVIVSVSKQAAPGYLAALAEQDIPVLAETPPAPDLAGLVALHHNLVSRGARIQVAEQYQFQPLEAARLSVINSGRLGDVTQATVSVTQTYHAMSLLRKMLGIGADQVTVRAMQFDSDWLAGPNRAGPPPEEKVITSHRELAWLDFGDKLGIYDFTDNQHRSWIRSNHLSVRGVRGEIFDRSLKVMRDFATPQPLEFARINKGEWENMEGHYLEGIMTGEEWVYRNPFAPGRLYDDEIAIATCLAKMADYAAGGPQFYGVPEASQDCYLGHLIEDAIRTGQPVTSVPQPWAEAVPEGRPTGSGSPDADPAAGRAPSTAQ